MERINEGGRKSAVGAAAIDPCAAAQQQRFDDSCGDQGALDIAAPGVQRDWLLGTIETEIIPRLMLGHPASTGTPELADLAPADRTIGEAELERFVDLILDGGLSDCMDRINALLRQGMAIESIYLELLSRAARRLGALWEDDERSFAEVTAGLWRLQHVMMELSPRAYMQSLGRAAPGSERSALVAPMPGSQHTFGAFMLSEVMLNAGWNVWTRPAVDADHLINVLRAQSFDVLCLSISTDEQLAAAPGLIHACRKASMNGELVVAVGGPSLNGATSAAIARLGADLGGLEARATERALRAVLRERAKSALSWA